MFYEATKTKPSDKGLGILLLTGLFHCSIPLIKGKIALDEGGLYCCPTPLIKGYRNCFTSPQTPLDREPLSQSSRHVIASQLSLYEHEKQCVALEYWCGSRRGSRRVYGL